jgi:serpin B
MTRWNRGGAWALACAMIATACGSRTVDAPSSVGGASVENQVAGAPTAAIDPTAATASNHFGFDLYQKLRGQDGNLIFSPASAEIALAMTSAGARGETLAQMESVLHLRGMVGAPAAFGNLLAALNGRDGQEGMTLHVANRLWGQENYLFDAGFVRLLGERYKAPLGRANFAGAYEAARIAINRWVAGETRDRIQDLLSKGTVDQDTRLVITNAVYFNGVWQVAFDPKDTKPDQFRTKGGPVTADLMHRMGTYRHRHVDGVQLAELPYGGGLSMLIVLPDVDDGLVGVEDRLAASYEGWIAGLAVKEVDLKIPRWKTVSEEMRLNKPLQELGMRLAFSDADFSAMTPEKLRISLVIQKAFVKVTEEGTEAAAATAVTLGGLAATIYRAVPSFHADHPFLYLIRDPETGLVLFVGRVLDPR